MESPLLQFAREENQRSSQLHAQTQAEAIGVELANRKMAFDKEANEKTAKLNTLGTLFNSYKGPARIDVAKQIGQEIGIDVSGIVNEESAMYRDLQELVNVMHNPKTKDNPQVAELAYQNFISKHPYAPVAKPERKATVDLGPEYGGNVDLTGDQAADYKAKMEALKAGLEEAHLKAKGEFLKLNKEEQDKLYDVAKDEWGRLFAAYKPALGADAQLMADPETYFSKAAEQPAFINVMMEKLSDADRIRFNKIRGIFDARLGLSKTAKSSKTNDSYFKDLGIE